MSITNLILDDNWQSLDKECASNKVQGWKRFEANTKGFPDGLKSTILRVRKQFPKLKHVALWHALVSFVLLSKSVSVSAETVSLAIGVAYLRKATLPIPTGHGGYLSDVMQ